MLNIEAVKNSKNMGARDFLALTILVAIVSLFNFNAHQLSAPLHSLQDQVNLDWQNLPKYASLTFLRMFVAVIFSFVFAVFFALMAAKSPRLEKVIIPIVDILQSVPILGFLSFTITFFMALFPGNRLGVELAAMFVIFTSQVWNMLLSAYQSFKNLPSDLIDVTKINKLSGFDRFFHFELPFAMPGLVWNSMLSMSSGWFFIVASESIVVGNIDFALPGIGSYIALAIEQTDLHAVLQAVLTMIIVIFLYDFLIFRPLVTWTEKFRFGDLSNPNPPHSIVLNLISENKFFGYIRILFAKLFDILLTLSYKLKRSQKSNKQESKIAAKLFDIVWYLALGIISLYGCYKLYEFLRNAINSAELIIICKSTLYTALRVFVLIILSLIIWVPIGIYIGLRPKLTLYAQSLLQFLSAFPVNLLFPLAVIAIKYYDLDPNIWLTLLMMIGTQWYILFNVVAGTSVFASDLKEVCANFNIKGVQWFYKVMIPSISPYIVTGIITACGGAWNCSILAELVVWGKDKYIAEGIGSYIAIATTTGDLQKVALGVIALSTVVILINRYLWHPLYAFTEQLTKAN